MNVILKKRKINKILISIMLLIVSVFPTFFNSVVNLANAVTVTGYTSVLGDLKIDDTFDESYYPSIDNDYSLNVIQIAESSGGELFIYVYQPSAVTKQLVATSINISQALNDSLSYKNYKLKLLDSDGVFAKYKVLDIEIRSDVVRYYDISNIFRAFDGSIDEQPGNGNTITEVKNKVAQEWTAVTLDGEVFYHYLTTQTIDVTDNYVGLVRYKDGFHMFSDSVYCDSHFIAFSTDMQIDRLMEADVYYTTVDYRYISTWTEQTGYTQFEYYTEPIEDYAYLDYTQSTEFKGTGWFSHRYTWDRIQSASDFLASEDRTNIFDGGIIAFNYGSCISDESYKIISNKQWVLRFCETEFSHSSTGYVVEDTCTLTRDVSIFRLKFETDGVVYNLGVVDNKTNGTGIPDNVYGLSVEVGSWTTEIIEFFKKAFKFLGVILLVVVIGVGIGLLSVFTPVFKYIWKAILFILKVVWWVFSAPFVAIFSLLKRGKT